MNEIVYLNTSKPTLTELGKTLAESRVLTSEFFCFTKYPTKCKVTINKTVVMDGVFVYHKDDDSPILLYKEFEVIKTGFTSDECLKNKQPWGWAVIMPKGLVLEFKSDDFVIEKSEMLQVEDKCVYTDDDGFQQQATYQGRREVKDVMFDFFLLENGKTCFFYPSEVKPPKFVKQ